MTTPHLRNPPFKADRFKKLVTGINASRPGGAEYIDPGDVWMLFDGGVAGIKGSMMSQFNTSDGKPMRKSVRTVHIHYSEDVLKKRYSRLKEGVILQQLESIHVVTWGRITLRQFRCDKVQITQRLCSSSEVVVRWSVVVQCGGGGGVWKRVTWWRWCGVHGPPSDE